LDAEKTPDPFSPPDLTIHALFDDPLLALGRLKLDRNLDRLGLLRKEIDRRRRQLTRGLRCRPFWMKAGEGIWFCYRCSHPGFRS
jgi:hypothetical protein